MLLISHHTLNTYHAFPYTQVPLEGICTHHLLSTPPNGIPTFCIVFKNSASHRHTMPQAEKEKERAKSVQSSISELHRSSFVFRRMIADQPPPPTLVPFPSFNSRLFKSQLYPFPSEILRALAVAPPVVSPSRKNVRKFNCAVAA